jgi:hypothetical protein
MEYLNWLGLSQQQLPRKCVVMGLQGDAAEGHGDVSEEQQAKQGEEVQSAG